MRRIHPGISDWRTRRNMTAMEFWTHLLGNCRLAVWVDDGLLPFPPVVRIESTDTVYDLTGHEGRLIHWPDGLGFDLVKESDGTTIYSVPSAAIAGPNGTGYSLAYIGRSSSGDYHEVIDLDPLDVATQLGTLILLNLSKKGVRVELEISGSVVLNVTLSVGSQHKYDVPSGFPTIVMRLYDGGGVLRGATSFISSSDSLNGIGIVEHSRDSDLYRWERHELNWNRGIS